MFRSEKQSNLTILDLFSVFSNFCTRQAERTSVQFLVIRVLKAINIDVVSTELKLTDLDHEIKQRFLA